MVSERDDAAADDDDDSYVRCCLRLLTFESCFGPPGNRPPTIHAVCTASIFGRRILSLLDEENTFGIRKPSLEVGSYNY